jgi:transposase
MPMYSKERRQEVLKLAAKGIGTRAIALQFNCSESWVRRVKQEFREQHKTGPATTRNRIPKWQAISDQIQQAIRARPDLTLRELKQELNTELSVQTLCRALQKLRLTIKKKS